MSSNRFTLLQFAGAVYAIAVAAHAADHIRRGMDSVTPEVISAGYIAIVAGFLTLVLIVFRNRFAPWAAVSVGFLQALGVAAVHGLPPWGPLSDSFLNGHVGPLSWAAVLFEIAASIALGAAGAYVLAGEREPAATSN